LAFAGLALSGQVQYEIEFTYDDAGNRISRQVILLKSIEDAPAAQQEEAEIVQPEVFSGRSGEYDIAVYPNPVKSSLTVAVTGAEAPQAWSVAVYDISGGLLLRKESVASEATIDLSAHKNGIYILTVILPSGESSWKVVKE